MASNTNNKNSTKSKKTISDSAEENTQVSVTQSKQIKPKDIDPEQYVSVKNGFQGKLVYRSKKTGETFVWDSFGSEQEIELRELKSVKNTYKKYFENNWFMFDEDWVIDYLGVRQYYKNSISVSDFDEIFNKKPSELTEIINGLSAGQKKSVAYRARQLIFDKKIDSLSMIDALEKALNVELIEK